MSRDFATTEKNKHNFWYSDVTGAATFRVTNDEPGNRKNRPFTFVLTPNQCIFYYCRLIVFFKDNIYRSSSGVLLRVISMLRGQTEAFPKRIGLTK